MTKKPAAKAPAAATKTDAKAAEPKADVKAEAAEAAEDADYALDDLLPGDVKRQEFLDLVAESAGLKRKDVRDGMIHTLTVMGKLLEDGRSLNLPPLGKVRIVKEKTVGQDARMLTLKVRHKDIVDEEDDDTEEAIAAAAE